MSDLSFPEAAVLGLVEGLTEFIPVSSTAHILLAERLMGGEPAGNGFEVLIQLGAILAVLAVYFGRLWQVIRGLGSDPAARKFVVSVLLAFFPAAIAGVLAHDFITKVLFGSPTVIAISLILGGLVLLAIDRWPPRARHGDAMDFPPGLALGIGLAQVVAMIPGVSRSGATIVGAMLLGAERRAAAEFSFFLSLPTIGGAFAYDLFKNRDVLSAADLPLVGIGFVVAFFSGLVVVRWMLDFISRRGFALFAWWRIGAGLATLLFLDY